tara:strand:+ start:814 stop:1728 length:915 start_codon:yes stop_codon:yes gene_type:complete
MRRVLKNIEWEDKFIKDGYIQIPFISPKEVAELKALFFDTLPESGGQITSQETGVEDSRFISYDFTFIDRNPDYKRKVFKIITEYFEPHMNRILDDFRPIIANYIRKKADTGEVPLHENWAFADEKKCTTVSIWCPLVDSTVENGTLQVVPGSQKRFGEYRGPMIPWELDGIKDEIIKNHLVPLETKAGDCVILDDSIVHYSAINKTPGLRLAIQLICVPSEEPSIHYHLDMQNNPNEIAVLKVSDEFYMEFNPWKKPEGVQVIQTILFEPILIKEDEFVKRLKAPAFDQEKLGFFQKLKKVLS